MGRPMADLAAFQGYTGPSSLRREPWIRAAGESRMVARTQ